MTVALALLQSTGLVFLFHCSSSSTSSRAGSPRRESR